MELFISEFLFALSFVWKKANAILKAAILVILLWTVPEVLVALLTDSWGIKAFMALLPFLAIIVVFVSPEKWKIGVDPLLVVATEAAANLKGLGKKFDKFPGGGIANESYGAAVESYEKIKNTLFLVALGEALAGLYIMVVPISKAPEFILPALLALVVIFLSGKKFKRESAYGWGFAVLIVVTAIFFLGAHRSKAVVKKMQAGVYGTIDGISNPSPKQSSRLAPQGASLPANWNLPTCSDAHKIVMSASHQEDYLDLQENCWSETVEMPTGDTITFETVGEGKNLWFQERFLNGDPNPQVLGRPTIKTVRDGDPESDGSNGVEVSHYLYNKVRFRGHGRLKFGYIKQIVPAATP